MGERLLVTVEARFATEEEPEQLGERVREAISMIVGKESLEEFRLRTLPLTPPKKPRGV
ncbi:MAG TPA: hypothetical protein VIC58_05935 [Actinomycetota bacterium]